MVPDSDYRQGYSANATPGSYCVVWDSGVEDLPEGFVTDRPWGKGDNPKTALFAYLDRLAGEGRKAADGGDLTFEIDKEIEHKIMMPPRPTGS